MLWLISSLVCFILIRYWKVTLPLGVALLAIGSSKVNQERTQFRGYDPAEFTEAEVQQAVRIMVPANVDRNGVGEWPVTLANNADKTFEGTFYVLCTATETVLDGTTNWVLGIKQYPYLLTLRTQIPSKSIATKQFMQVSDDMGPDTNLTKCGFYSDDRTVASAKDAIDVKWIQVTPRGAARAREIGYTWMDIPQGFNSPDYQSPW